MSFIQVNIWGAVLKTEEIKKISSCRSDLQGDEVSWNSDIWQTKGTSNSEEIDPLVFCQDTPENQMYLFEPISLIEAFSVCESIKGNLPTAKNLTEFESLSRNIAQYIEASSSSFTCNKIWMNLTDEDLEGRWTNIRNDKSKEELEEIQDIAWKTGEPDGNKVQNCAILDSRHGELAIKDTECHHRNCLVCIVNHPPNWVLLGACIFQERNKYFVSTQEWPEERLKFIGYSDYIIIHDEGSWHWKERHNDTIIAVLENDLGHDVWPQGRRSWKLRRPVCNQTAGESRTLLLTSCGFQKFTCDDGSCIHLNKRCNLKPDCNDGSDETGCVLVEFPPSYRNDIPPEFTEPSTFNESSLPIALDLIIESLSIDTSNMVMDTNLNLSMTWTDGRINLLNLNDDKTLNRFVICEYYSVLRLAL